MKDHPCILFAGSSNPALAFEITRVPGLDIKLGSIYHHSFPSGECYCQLKENVRGADVFLFQSTSTPANDNLMQLLVMADAARRASAGRITAVIPYFGYSRQDRKDKPRVPITAKMIMNLLEAAGVNRIITMDLHAQQIQGFTDLPFDHLYFQPTLAAALKDKNIEVVVSPDIGAVKKASEYAKNNKLGLAFIVKDRKSDTDVEVAQFVGDVRGKNVLLLDDLTESLGTLEAGAIECKKNGAKEVHCAVTHGCITDVGYQRLEDAHKKGIINTFFRSDTVPGTRIKPDYVTVVSVAEVFGKAIDGIHNNRSITSLFS